MARTYLELRSRDEPRPAAMPRLSYLQRGFLPVREETYTADV